LIYPFFTFALQQENTEVMVNLESVRSPKPETKGAVGKTWSAATMGNGTAARIVIGLLAILLIYTRYFTQLSPKKQFCSPGMHFALQSPYFVGDPLQDEYRFALHHFSSCSDFI